MVSIAENPQPNHLGNSRSFLKIRIRPTIGNLLGNLIGNFSENLSLPLENPDVTCYKCGKKGHFCNYCRFSRKLLELQLEEETLDEISALLLDSSNSKTCFIGSSEGQNLQIDELVTTSLSETKSSSKQVYVLTKGQNLILDASFKSNI